MHASMSSSPGPSECTSFWQSIHRAAAAVHALGLVLGPLPDSLAFSEDPASSLLHDETIALSITLRLRAPGSSAGGNNLCRWLYDTFQSTVPELQLVVLKFIPTLVGVYFSRAGSPEPVAGFEAVLLALYAHETVARAGNPCTIILPSLTNASLYHEAKASTKNKPVDLDIAIFSPVLEPHGTVRSTKRAKIVGVALELYYGKIAHMPTSSKLEFVEFCVVWAGQDAKVSKGGRIPLPWELFQPILRVVGHCILGPTSSEALKAAATRAARCLHERAAKDVEPQAILASRSLLRLGQMVEEEMVWEAALGDGSEAGTPTVHM
ncbi:uncharacterized protein [Typha latifolia]|uniref:uncharacterized protein n=1 Tax=Typha latifolia TaxID=4733 RepID=UPI003C2F7BF8